MSTIRFDHTNDNFFRALDIDENLEKWLKENVEDSSKKEDRVSASLITLIERIQKEVIGENNDISKYELLLITAGFMLGRQKVAEIKLGGGELSQILKQAVGDGKASIEMPDILKKLLKIDGKKSEEKSEIDKELEIAFVKDKSGMKAVFSGTTDFEVGMKIMNLLKEISDKKE